ncbi:MAG: DUF2179 domain-containing protein [Candidatus Fermentibacteraceae bacterium]|nr:DUF2179 domain-containing protein [Candidatus Fermentibacteraceae bacterium]
MTGTVLLTGLLVFLARVLDVSLGTIRTISIIQGRTVLAFFLGFIEVSIWLGVISAVIGQVQANPVMAVFYALGFATGNVIGIMIERRLAMGSMVIKIMARDSAHRLATRIREMGFGVTEFQGTGMTGTVTELYIVCARKEFKGIMQEVRTIDPDIFYVTEPVGTLGSGKIPSTIESARWKGIFKKK